MPVLFAETGGLIFTETGFLAMDVNCCCPTEITCCSFVGQIIYVRICLTNCTCTGIPVGFTEIDFTLSWSGINSRWEGSFSIPGCGTTLNVRLTYVEIFDPTECQFFWSDDACSGNWLVPPRQVDTTNCNITCDPFLFSSGHGGSNERYRSCCPGGTWPDGEGPGFVAYGYCTPEDRATRGCNP